MADMNPPPPPPPIHDHHPPPPIPAPRINSCTLTGIPIITIFEKYQVHYEFDRKLKKMALHKCRCQYVPTELDLSILTSRWSQEHNTPIFMCFNHFSNCREFYIFDKGIGGFEQVDEPRRCYPTRIGGNKVAATIYTDDENPEEHVVIEAGHGEPPKKLIWNNGQYLKLESMTLNTFLMREIQEMENPESEEDDGEEGDEEDRKFKTYFDVMQPYIFTVWRENTWLNALDRQTGLYTTFIYHNKQFSRNRAFSDFNSIFEYHLSLAYMEKYDGKCVFHCRNLQFDRMEQYIFDCTSKQFVQVFYEDLPFNPTKVQNFQDVLVSDGDAKFSIIILNGSFTIAEFSEVDSCFSHRPARAVKTFAVQKAEKEKRKKAKRHGDSDGRVVVPEKRRDEQGAQNFGANNSTAQPTQSSSGVQNFNITSAKIIIRQNPADQQSSQLSFSCQCSQQSNSQPQTHPTVMAIQQTVQNQPKQPATNPMGVQILAASKVSTSAGRAPQQPVNNNKPVSVSQAEKTVAQKQRCDIQQVLTGPQQPPQQQKQPVTSTQNESRLVTAASAHAVPTKNAQTQQPAQAQVLASSGVASNSSNQRANSSVSTIKAATAPSNNLGFHLQQTGSTNQQTVQNQPKQTATNSTVAQKPAESQVSNSAVQVSTNKRTVQKPQQSVNNCKSTSVSQPASAPSAPVTAERGPQSEKTVAQKQGCEVQKAQNGSEKTLQQQMQPQPKSNSASTSVKTVKAHIVTTNNVQPEQRAGVQAATTAGNANNISNRSINLSIPTATALSNNPNSQPQKTDSTTQQTVQNQPKQPATNPTIAQKTAESKVATSAVHVPQQAVNNSSSATVRQPASAPSSAAKVAANSNSVVQNTGPQKENGTQGLSQQQMQPQPVTSTLSKNAATSTTTVKLQQAAQAQIATTTVNTNNNSNQSVNTSVSTAKPATATSSNLNSQPQQTVSDAQHTVQNQPKQLANNLSIAQKPTESQVSTSSVHTSSSCIRSVSSSVPTIKPTTVSSDISSSEKTVAQKQGCEIQQASAPSSTSNVTIGNSSAEQQIGTQSEKTVTQKQGFETQKNQDGPQQPVQQQNFSSSPSGRNVTVQFYNNNMFWMKCTSLVAQRHEAPMSDCDLASILSQQQQSVNSNPATASQSADAPSSGATVLTGNSSEAEPVEKFQNGPQKASRKQIQPQRVTSTQLTTVTAVNAQPQQPAQPKVLASSGVASNNSNQGVNSATSAFANLTRGLKEADENARAPRLDAYGPNGGTSIAQRTRSKLVKQSN